MTTSQDNDREFQRKAPHMTNVGSPGDGEPVSGNALDAEPKVKRMYRRGVSGELPAATLMAFDEPPEGWMLYEPNNPAKTNDGEPNNPAKTNDGEPNNPAKTNDGEPAVMSALNAPDGQDHPNWDKKDPKQAWGDKKIPAASINPLVLLEEAHQMHIGEYKYGFANYVGSELSAMTYVHAMMRHYILWAGGEDNDPDSGVSHLQAIRACCGILRTQQMKGTMIDDRPDWGDVREMVNYLDAMWLEIMPKLDEQIKGMEK